jgi:hypothetical protein
MYKRNRFYILSLEYFRQFVHVIVYGFIQFGFLLCPQM